MKKRILLSLAAFLILGFGVRAKATLITNSNSIIQDNIEYYMQTDKSVYNLGEEVEMLYRVTNLGEEEWGSYHARVGVDFTVEAREGENFNEIWYWSWDKFFPDDLIVFTLPPGESMEFNGTWPQINLNGSGEPEDHTQVPAGAYRTSGHLAPYHQTALAVDITIIPEPCTLLLLGLGGLVLLKRRKS